LLHLRTKVVLAVLDLTTNPPEGHRFTEIWRP
jgi:hypothetical protein